MSGQFSIILPPLFDVAPFDPTRGGGMETGAYAVRIDDVTQKPPSANNPNNAHGSVRFSCTVTEPGPYQGRTIDIYIGLNTDNSTIKAHWRNLMVGIGAPDNLLRSTINTGPQSFIGKNAFVYNEAAPEGEKDEQGRKKLDNRTFIDGAAYQKYKANPRPTAAAAQMAPTAQFQAPPQIGSAFPGTQAQPPAFVPGQAPAAPHFAIPQPAAGGVAALGTAFNGQPPAAAGTVTF